MATVTRGAVVAAKGMELLDKFANEEGFQIVALSQEMVDQAIALFRSRPDKEWGMTDCVSFVLMEREGMTQVAYGGCSLSPGRL